MGNRQLSQDVLFEYKAAQLGAAASNCKQDPQPAAHCSSACTAAASKAITSISTNSHHLHRNS
jgi:hypothetical protein